MAVEPITREQVWAAQDRWEKATKATHDALREWQELREAFTQQEIHRQAHGLVR